MTTANLSADISYLSLNHAGEQLCGDHVEVLRDPEERSTVIVLADGLGSGVKANILSILTSKIISTMVASGLRLEDAVETIAATLPICSVRGIAYSTFTILHLVGSSQKVYMIEYDNPGIIVLRDGKQLELPSTVREIDGKSIVCSEMTPRRDDVLIAMSDGVEHAGIGGIYNFGWRREDIAKYMSSYCGSGFTAKTLAGILVEETNRLYAGAPGDDATACVVKFREQAPANLLIGPPSNPDDCNRMMSMFFAREGRHIICGGTTSNIAAEYLHKPVRPSLKYIDPDIPPTAELEGADLVTEGIITVNRVLEYARDCLQDNKSYDSWGFKQDGASRVSRMLFEEASEINFFVGRAVNPAHQNPNLPINFSIKMKLVEELADCLRKMGKKVRLKYF